MRPPRAVKAVKVEKVDEVVQLEPSTSFMCGRATSARLRYWWHAHPEMEVVSVQSGRGLRHVGDSIEPFHDHELILVGAGTPHAWYTDGDDDGPVDIVFAQFRAGSFTEAARSLPELRGIAALLPRAGRGLRLVGIEGRSGRDGLRELHAERDPARRLRLLIGVLAAFGDGSRCRALASDRFAAAPADTRCDRLRRFLHEHRADPIPHERAAAMVGISPAGFSRFFKSRFNCTFRDYLSQLRIADACRLLAETDRPVIDIALACGFQNLSNFNRRFLARRGSTPSAYRRRARPPG